MATQETIFMKEIEVNGSFAHPDIDSPKSVTNSASRLSVNGTSTATKIHKYPLFVDRGKQGSALEETARECIRFTVVKQGGVTFKNGDLENSRQAALKSEISKRTNTIEGFNAKISGITNLLSSGKISQKEQLELQESAANAFQTAKEERAELLVDEDNLGIVPIGVELFKTGIKRARQPETDLEHCFLYMPPSVV
ncbi:uncharacterized protein METZ01_LOCUS178217, partial [marine metagenome]